MNGEIANVERKVEGLRQEVERRFDIVHADLKEMAQALKELIRMDGDLKRQNDALTRIGKHVDDVDGEVSEIEKRLRAVEIGGARQGVTVENHDKLNALRMTAIASIVSGVVVGIIVYAVTH